MKTIPTLCQDQTSCHSVPAVQCGRCGLQRARYGPVCNGAEKVVWGLAAPSPHRLQCVELCSPCGLLPQSKHMHVNQSFLSARFLLQMSFLTQSLRISVSSWKQTEDLFVVRQTHHSVHVRFPVGVTVSVGKAADLPWVDPALGGPCLLLHDSFFSLHLTLLKAANTDETGSVIT